MGDAADMILEGIACQRCGEYLGEGDGYAVTCDGCQDDTISSDYFSDVLEQLFDAGYMVGRFTQYHYTIEANGKRIDLFPTNHKYHDVTNNIRGFYTPDKLYNRVIKFFNQ